MTEHLFFARRKTSLSASLRRGIDVHCHSQAGVRFFTQNAIRQRESQTLEEIADIVPSVHQPMSPRLADTKKPSSNAHREETLLGFFRAVRGGESNTAVYLPRASSSSQPPLMNRSSGREQVPLQTRLNSAIEKQDRHALLQLWNEARIWYGKSKALGMNSEHFYLHMHRRFMAAFIDLKETALAINVWNDMHSHGLTPEPEVWNILLNGFRKAKDIASVEELWNKMRASGVSPNIRCWTTRISAIFGARNFAGGMDALTEMVHEWLDSLPAPNQTIKKGESSVFLTDMEAAQGSESICMPTIAPFNAAVAHLIRWDKADDARRVLDFAAFHGINPDIITYNQLLSHYVKRGLEDHTSKILKEMVRSNTKPDIATFTIFLNDIFRKSKVSDSSSSTKEQQLLVDNVLGQMEDSGVPPNVWSYGTIINSLLRLHRNIPATRAVLDHMVSRSIKPSSHIYTMLLTHHFSRSPPELAAIDGLWDFIQMHGGVIDIMFYDRMIEGYARAHDANKMMAFLGRMAKEGKTPSWRALRAVITALDEMGDWEKIGYVLQDVQEEMKSHGDQRRDRKGEELFWEVVQNLERKGFMTKFA
ncbi:MAG: hypothetical protein M1824_001196 [Vezdaea acicularis]|nr:MAG: hypothetical protein M1824_001196 [Vezdaea acicularis]